jgi:hypothetical protein
MQKISFLLVLSLAFLFAGCSKFTNGPTPDPVEPPVPEVKDDFDGLSQDVFNTTVRIRNNTGTGSGSVISDLGESYEIETNHHVAGRGGSPLVVDIWYDGDLVGSYRSQSKRSWFEDGKSKDIAVIEIPKKDLSGPLAVVPTAPEGFAQKVKTGDKVYMIGCANGRWPRARCGNVLDHKNGLIWYEPESIGGDSGSGVYYFDKDSQKWLCVGRTAWAIQVNGKWQGLAMDSDRVRAIREGRVSEGWDLPEGAVPIETIQQCEPDSPIALPHGAMRLDSMYDDSIVRTSAQEPQASPASDEAKPLEVQIREWGKDREISPEDSIWARLFKRHQEENVKLFREESKPIRESIGKGIFYILLAVAGSTAFILISGYFYLRTKFGKL